MTLPKFRVISAAAPTLSGLTPLPHLAEGSWVKFELEIAQHLSNALEQELKKLKHHVNKERVHKSRVALRRWFSIWEVLKKDGWETKKFAKKIIKPLKKLQKKLGKVRDMDINIALAKKFGCNRSLIKTFLKKRRKARAAVESTVKALEFADLLESINEHLFKQGQKLQESLLRKQNLDHSPSAHFNSYISNHEKLVEKLVRKAQDPEALHELRLAVKQWRYLLTECLGLSNKELVMTQDCLGEIHDLDSFRLALEKLGPHIRLLHQLKNSRRRLMQEFIIHRHQLPFGLRPGMRSVKKQTFSN